MLFGHDKATVCKFKDQFQNHFDGTLISNKANGICFSPQTSVLAVFKFGEWVRRPDFFMVTTNACEQLAYPL